jgi:hypothetical protein
MTTNTVTSEVEEHTSYSHAFSEPTLNEAVMGYGSELQRPCRAPIHPDTRIYRGRFKTCSVLQREQ